MWVDCSGSEFNTRCKIENRIAQKVDAGGQQAEGNSERILRHVDEKGAREGVREKAAGFTVMEKQRPESSIWGNAPDRAMAPNPLAHRDGQEKGAKAKEGPGRANDHRHPQYRLL